MALGEIPAARDVSPVRRRGHPNRPPVEQEAPEGVAVADEIELAPGDLVEALAIEAADHGIARIAPVPDQPFWRIRPKTRTCSPPLAIQAAKRQGHSAGTLRGNSAVQDTHEAPAAHGLRIRRLRRAAPARRSRRTARSTIFQRPSGPRNT